MMPGSTDVLRSLFPRLTVLSQQTLLQKARIVTYPAATTLCHDGAIEHLMYVLLWGSIDIYMYQDGQRFYVDQLKVGATFGEMGLILDQPRIGDVVTAEEVTVLEIDKPVVDYFLEHEPRIVIEIMRLVATRLISQQELLLAELASLRRLKEPPPPIFMSYSRRDEAFVRRLHRELSKRGMNLWLDVLFLEPGASWGRGIQKALDNCRVMLVVLSPASVESSNVEDEWSYYLSTQKSVIPVLIESCDVPFRLNKLQYVDFTQAEFASAVTRLAGVLDRLLVQA